MQELRRSGVQVDLNSIEIYSCVIPSSFLQVSKSPFSPSVREDDTGTLPCGASTAVSRERGQSSRQHEVSVTSS